jgi:hemerythrin
MPYCEFSKDVQVGIQSIDQQHKKFCEIVNLIHDDIIDANKTRVMNHFNELLEELKEHFTNEEMLMKETNFLGYISHKLEHDRFFHQCHKLLDDLIEGKGVIGLEQLKVIKRWFYNHIEINDRKCALHFIEKGYS